MGISDSRRATISLGLDPKGLDPGIDEARRKLRAFEDSVRSDERKKRRGGGFQLTNFALGGAVAGVAGEVIGRAIEYFKELGGEVLDIERSMTRLEIATGGAIDMGKFRASLSDVSKETGIARKELLSGASAYVALTGDGAGAAQAVGLFAKVANASGASMADIASTAAALKDNLKIDPADFQKGFDVLITQGKLGAVELKDLATQMAGIAPTFSQFKGGTGLKGLTELGAAMQIGRKGFGSAAEAATGVRALVVSLNRGAGKFAAAGVKIFVKNPKTGKKEMRGFAEILDDIATSKLAKDPTLLTKAFGSDEAKRMFDQLVKNRGLFEELRKNTGENAVEKDAAKFLESPAARIEKAMNAMRESIAAAMTPERIAAFAGALENAVKLAGELADRINRAVSVGGSMAREFRKVTGHYGGDEDIAHDARQRELKRRLDKGARVGAAYDTKAEEELRDRLWRGEKSTGEKYSVDELRALRQEFQQHPDRYSIAESLAGVAQHAIDEAIRQSIREGAERHRLLLEIRTSDEAVTKQHGNSKDHRIKLGRHH